jgi:DNA-binding transcriptional regulator YiaG
MTRQEFKKFRKSLNMSQAEFAIFIGLSPFAIRAWEQGKNPVPRWVNVMIACLKDNSDLDAKVRELEGK